MKISSILLVILGLACVEASNKVIDFMNGFLSGYSGENGDIEECTFDQDLMIKKYQVITETFNNASPFDMKSTLMKGTTSVAEFFSSLSEDLLNCKSVGKSITKVKKDYKNMTIEKLEEKVKNDLGVF